MSRTLLLSLAVLATAVALAVGSYTALAGSNPVGDVTDAVIGSDSPNAGDNETGNADSVEADVEESGDTSVATDANVQQESNTGAGAEHVAGVIADEFGVSQDEVLALHEQGIGFGALFKLYSLARATGTTVDDLLASIGDDGYAFGKRFKDLTEEQQAVLDSGPKNLGALVSASHHPDAGGDAEAGATLQTQAQAHADVKFAANSSTAPGLGGALSHGHK